ncbi:DUF4861 domain-containing protein [Limibacter armeniacum]|uniref:DUF4861 domain-containing protein n=1 Tax=Limibacter armeniacum TaxID=466084 RepID=UPI002FE5C00C
MKQNLKNILISLVLFTLIIFSCEKQKENTEIILKNNLDIARADEPVTIKKSALSLPYDQFIIIDEEGLLVPFQKDDLNGDQQWDELALVLDFMPQQQRKLYIKAQDSLPVFKATTNVRLGKSPERNGTFTDVVFEKRDKKHLPQSQPPLYQMEGVSWENDKVGFRTYFDSRNGKDIWGKKTPELVLDWVGTKGNYHEMDWWGMDILKVGNSLGAGALAMEKEQQLYRLGETEDAIYEMVSEGPARTKFRLHYKGWQVDDHTYNLTEEITLWKGQYCYESQVTLTDTVTSNLVTGIVNMDAKELYVDTLDENYAMLYTHDIQSLNKDHLGMGLIVPKTYFNGYGETAADAASISSTYFCKLKPNGQEPVKFYFFAGWEVTDSLFSHKAGFEKMLKENSLKLNNPIQIEIHQ